MGPERGAPQPEKARYLVNADVLNGMTSEFLDFGPMGAGKVKGLAAYGRPDPSFERLQIRNCDGDQLAYCPGEEAMRPELLTGFYSTGVVAAFVHDQAEQIWISRENTATMCRSRGP